jgi:hypothetical protein
MKMRKIQFILFFSIFCIELNAQVISVHDQNNKDTLFLFVESRNRTNPESQIYSGRDSTINYWHGPITKKIYFSNVAFIDELKTDFSHVKRLKINIQETTPKLELSKFSNLEELTIEYYPYFIDSNDLSVLPKIKKLTFHSADLFSKSLFNYSQKLTSLEQVTFFEQRFFDGYLTGIYLNNPAFCSLPNLKSINFIPTSCLSPIAVLLRNNVDSLINYVYLINLDLLFDFNPWCKYPSFISLADWSELIKNNTETSQYICSYVNWKNKFPINGPYIVNNTFNGDTIHSICKGFFKNRKPHGKWLFYNCNGNIVEERNYVDGIPDGIWKYSTYTNSYNDINIIVFDKGKLLKYNEIEF